jgi:hypothetical protein
MSYRDDLDAARHRRESLARELADVRARLGDRDALVAEEQRLAAELEDTQAHIEHARTRVELPLLREVSVASPCQESWAAMKGDDRVRFCGRCEKNVFDLSEMTAVEAEAVLAAHGGAACVRFYRRADGTVMTSDCPEGARRRRRRNLVLAGALAVGTAAAAAGLALAGDERCKCGRTVGESHHFDEARLEMPGSGSSSGTAPAIAEEVRMGAVGAMPAPTIP